MNNAWRFAHLFIAVTILPLGLVGCGSDSITEPVDSARPKVTAAAAIDSNLVKVVFNERVEKATAERPENYLVIQTAPLSSANGLSFMKPELPQMILQHEDTIAVYSAVRQADKRTVILTTAPRLTSSALYDVKVSGVRDVSGNTIAETRETLRDEILHGKIFTLAGTGVAGRGDENVDPLQSLLSLPLDVTYGPDGLLYIVDWNNHRIRVIENGKIRTFIATGELGDAEPGYALDISLNHPTNVAFDPDGNLILSAWHNSMVLRMDMNTQWIDRICGDGRRTFAGDGGPGEDALVNLPSSVAFDMNGRMYISDQANQRIRMVDEDGIIATVVGNGTRAFCGDGGPAVSACLRNPTDQFAQPTGRIAFDAPGNLYIADTWNRRVRKVDTNGIITTLAGNGAYAFAGDGGPATAASLRYPSDVAVGPNGNVYIADTESHCIRMVDKNGIITTVVGQGERKGFAGDGDRAMNALLNSPWGVAFDSAGNMYIADTENQRIRIVYK